MRVKLGKHKGAHPSLSILCLGTLNQKCPLISQQKSDWICLW